jgi:dolichol-phosphate mannosyltransferase
MTSPTGAVNASPSPLFAFPQVRAAGAGPALSVVVPMHDESGGAAALIAEISVALAGLDCEIVAVDDASKDATREALLAARAREPRLRVLTHAVNAGQSRAVRTGVLAARAPVVATIDGDGQNDPADIRKLYVQLTRPDASRLLAMVGGERQKRQDTAAKRYASRFANSVRSRLLRDRAKDTGCGLKVFYREAFLRLPAFDHMHRYLPALMAREGYEVEFAPVNHRPRTHGRSKYTNLGRAVVAIRDLMGVLWLNDRARRPGEISEL